MLTLSSKKLLPVKKLPVCADKNMKNRKGHYCQLEIQEKELKKIYGKGSGLCQRITF
jgi:hypothetical protein